MSETAHWQAAVSGNFADAADWSTGVVPGIAGSTKEPNSDTALLDATGGPYTVTFDNRSSNGEVYNLAFMSVSANATLYVVSSRGMETGLLADLTENDGKIVVGVAEGGSGALLSGYNDTTQVNNGLIVIKADGQLTSPIDNQGVIQVLGGVASVRATTGGGKWRINGGTLQWGDSYLGAVNFNGPNGGTFELGENTNAMIADVSGFSRTGNTSIVIDGWTQNPNFKKIIQTASSTELVLRAEKDIRGNHWIRLNGDYIGATFSSVVQNGNLVITCQQSPVAPPGPSTQSFTQAMACQGAPSGPALAAAVTAPRALPALLAAAHN